MLSKANIVCMGSGSGWTGTDSQLLWKSLVSHWETMELNIGYAREPDIGARNEIGKNHD